MGLADMLGAAFEKANSGELPEHRDTVEACLMHSFFGLLSVWMTDGRAGAVELAQEVDHLVKALKNKEDTMLQDFDHASRMALWAGLNTLTKQKESITHAASQSPEETPHGGSAAV